MRNTLTTDVIIHPKFNEFCRLSQEIVDGMAKNGFDPDAVIAGLMRFGLKVAANNALSKIVEEEAKAANMYSEEVPF